MTTSQPTPTPPPPAILAGVLSYLVPGLGQVYQGRIAKGLMFMVILLGMFMLGQAMGRWRNVFMPAVQDANDPIRRPLVSVYNRWHFAGQFWIGIAAWPAIWQFYRQPEPNEDPNAFWTTFQRSPEEDETRFNQWITDQDKEPDLGWVYTVVAGMLNILVIYDAVMGPAFIATPHTEKATAPEGSA
jgi:hypothetical protein